MKLLKILSEINYEKKDKCECENIKCSEHKMDKSCHNKSDGIKTIYGTTLCKKCAQFMPKEFLSTLKEEMRVGSEYHFYNIKKPSINMIASVLHIDSTKATQIRKEMDSVYNSDLLDKALENINKLLDGYGIEAIRDNEFSGYFADIGILYINMGDTYDSTILFDTRKEKFYVTSLGNMVEAEPKRFNI